MLIAQAACQYAASTDFSNWITAGATVLYVIVSYFMWQAIKRGNVLTQESNDTTRSIFEATNRPLVYAFEPRATLDPYNKNIGLTLRVGNAGQQPTRGLIVRWRVFSDAQEFHNDIPPKPYIALTDWNVDVLLEGDVNVMSKQAIIVVGEPMDDILKGLRPLAIRVDFTYKGLADHPYSDGTTYYYDANKRRMTADESAATGIKV